MKILFTWYVFINYLLLLSAMTEIKVTVDLVFVLVLQLLIFYGQPFVV